MRRSVLLVPAVALALLALGCIERAPGARPNKRRNFDYSASSVQAVLARNPPQVPLHGVFGNAIELIGYDLEPPKVPPGSAGTITLYWRAIEELDADWQVFVHMDGREGQERIHGDHWPAGGAYHTDVWRKGDVVKDAFHFSIPGFYKGDVIDAWLGLYQGDERLPISNPGEVRHDGQNRMGAVAVPLR